MIGDRIGATVLLGTTAIFFAIIVGIAVGAKGCEDGSVTKLLEENARLKIELDQSLSSGSRSEAERSSLAQANQQLHQELDEINQRILERYRIPELSYIPEE